MIAYSTEKEFKGNTEEYIEEEAKNAHWFMEREIIIKIIMGLVVLTVALLTIPYCQRVKGQYSLSYSIGGNIL